MSNEEAQGTDEVAVPVDGIAILLRRAFSTDVPLILATTVILAIGALYSTTLLGIELFGWYQGLLGVLAISIWALLTGLERIPHVAERRLWMGIALSLAAYFVADFSWVFFPDAYYTMPGQLLEELCYLALYLLILFSIELQPHRVVPAKHLEVWRSQRRFELQGGTLFVLGLLVSFVLIPIRASTEDYASYAPSGCLYVTLDLLIIVRTLHASHRATTHRWRTLYRVLLLAETAMLGTDSADLLYYFSVIEEPKAFYLLWYLYPLLFVVAGRLRHVLPNDDVTEQSEDDAPELSKNPFSNILLAYTLLLPALHLVFQYFAIFDFATTRQRIPVILVYIFAFLVLIGRHQRFEQTRIEALEAEGRKGEAQLREAMLAAQAANKAKSQFLANMSHEIRTPMNGVLGTADLLLRADVTAERQRAYLETIRASGDTLLTIINDILDLSKIESGNLTVEWAPYRLRSTIQSSLSLVSPIAASKGLSLSYTVETPLCERLVGDVTRTRQILVNLLNNAIKFTDSGKIRVSLATRDLGDGNHEAHFTVTDSGIGIAAKDLGKLFEPFSQVDPSMTRRHGGTGLGLAICRRLCELMGGRIWVDSTVGAGSTFHFTIRGEGAAEDPPVRSSTERSLPPTDSRRR